MPAKPVPAPHMENATLEHLCHTLKVNSTAGWLRNRTGTGTVGTVFPETESGTGTAGTVFQESKPELEPFFPVKLY